MVDSGFIGSVYLRRLPLYLLLDCSETMGDERMGAVSDGLQMLYSTLMRDPQAVETVYISVIRFADIAEQEELIPITEFLPEALGSGGGCALGAALHVLVESLENDLLANTESRKGDYRPMAFVLLGGHPTDDWRYELQALRSLRGHRQPTIIALACTDTVDVSLLSELTPHAFDLQSVTPERLLGFFGWLSGSVVNATSAVAEQGGVRSDFAVPAAFASKVRPITGSRKREEE